MVSSLVGKFFIFSTKPYKRTLFIFVRSCVVKKPIGFLNSLLVAFGFIGSLGISSLYLVIKNFKICLGLLHFVVKFSLFKVFVNKIKKLVYNLWYGWLISFKIVGYHYQAFRCVYKKIKRTYLLFKLGFYYNLLIKFPKYIKIFWKKRFFRLKGPYLYQLVAFALFIRMVRNVFPYKKKGITFNDENFVLKIGKKVKYR